MASIETLGETFKVTSRTYSLLKTEASEARRYKASHQNTMEFIHDIKVPSSLTRATMKLDYYKNSSRMLRKVMNKYIANLLIAEYLGMSITYSRDRALKIKGPTSTYLLVRCEEILIEKGYINAIVDSDSPLANRKKCRIDVCIDLNSVIPCLRSVLEMNRMDVQEAAQQLVCWM